jgi:excisionase family DNA binding protein
MGEVYASGDKCSRSLTAILRQLRLEVTQDMRFDHTGRLIPFQRQIPATGRTETGISLLPATPSLDRTVYVVEEVAAILRCGRTTVFGLLREGELHGLKAGRRRLVSGDSLRSYLDRGFQGGDNRE